MVKYYCDVCNNLIAKRYTVAVKTPDGETKPAVHLCPNCHRSLQTNFVELLNVKRSGNNNTKEAAKEVCDNYTQETGNNNTVCTASENASVDVPASPVPEKNDLPKRPHGRVDIPRLRKVLIDYYSGVNETTTRSRVGCDSATYKRLVRDYASATIRQRYDEERSYKHNGTTIKAGEVLSLYAAGLPMEEIERDTGFVSGVIESILAYFTGV